LKLIGKKGEGDNKPQGRKKNVEMNVGKELGANQPPPWVMLNDLDHPPG